MAKNRTDLLNIIVSSFMKHATEGRLNSVGYNNDWKRAFSAHGIKHMGNARQALPINVCAQLAAHKILPEIGQDSNGTVHCMECVVLEVVRRARQAATYGMLRKHVLDTLRLVEDKFGIVAVCPSDTSKRVYDWVSVNTPPASMVTPELEPMMINRLQVVLKLVESIVMDKLPAFRCDCGQALVHIENVEAEQVERCKRIFNNLGVYMQAGAMARQIVTAAFSSPAAKHDSTYLDTYLSIAIQDRTRLPQVEIDKQFGIVH